MALIGTYFSSISKLVRHMTYAALPGVLQSFFTGALELVEGFIGRE